VLLFGGGGLGGCGLMGTNTGEEVEAEVEEIVGAFCGISMANKSSSSNCSSSKLRLTEVSELRLGPLFATFVTFAIFAGFATLTAGFAGLFAKLEFGGLFELFRLLFC
jgi:hypothetical protein